ncbi:MAG TPA: NAD-dependent epimerase/dehydratase family protein [Candidatus Eisenbacteria bacterium]|nr:NAD-dependent epimerase/dehydratase family protein [Candidatus Eisenbacteria bacterium]
MSLDHARAALSGKKILVTGATGCIGGRLVERLATECRVSIRALVRSVPRAFRIARFPIEFVRGDILDAEIVARALDRCDIVFHCAYGNTGSEACQRAVNLAGTENVLKAASRNRKLLRLIHLSTVLVYGITEDGEIDERAPRRYTGGVYPDSKLDAEERVLECARSGNVPATVLQPTEVYGPYASVWTENVFRRLTQRRVLLIDGGDGWCSPVYVDDVVSAMLLAATSARGLGEAFLIGAAQPTTWKEFYTRFENLLDVRATVPMAAGEAERLYRQSRRRRRGLLSEGLKIAFRNPEIRNRLGRTREAELLRRFARLVPAPARRRLKSALRDGGPPGGRGESPMTADRPLELLDPLMIRFYRRKTAFRIDKARRLLGYEPRVSLDAGLELTGAWARWSNLLPPRADRPND